MFQIDKLAPSHNRAIIGVLVLVADPSPTYAVINTKQARTIGVRLWLEMAFLCAAVGQYNQLINQSDGMLQTNLPMAAPAYKVPMDVAEASS